MMIMERYTEKQLREIPPSHKVSDIQRGFRRKFELNDCALKEWLRGKDAFTQDVFKKRLSDVKS